MPPGSARVRDAASVMAAMHSGRIVLHGHLNRRFGADPLDREHATRIGVPMLDVHAAMGEFATSPTLLLTVLAPRRFGAVTLSGQWAGVQRGGA